MRTIDKKAITTFVQATNYAIPALFVLGHTMLGMTAATISLTILAKLLWSKIVK